MSSRDCRLRLLQVARGAEWHTGTGTGEAPPPSCATRGRGRARRCRVWRSKQILYGRLLRTAAPLRLVERVIECQIQGEGLATLVEVRERVNTRRVPQDEPVGQKTSQLRRRHRGGTYLHQRALQPINKVRLASGRVLAASPQVLSQLWSVGGT